MFVALLIVLPLTALFLAWFYLFRNNTDIPVSPGAKPIVGHMHQFMDITMENLHLFEERYFKITDPAKAGPVSHMKFFFKSNFSLNTVKVAQPLFKSNVNVDKSFQYDDFAGWLADSVIILPGKEWHKRRLMLTPAFHFSILDDFSQTMKKHSEVLQYVPLPDYSKVEVAEEDRTRINTGHRYTVWLDKSDSDYICLRKLERSAESSKSRSSYRGFSSGHGILRLHVREAFIPEHCPLANPSTMNYLHRALPNCPPPDMEMSVESDEPSNILIAAMIHRTPTNIEQRVTYSMLLFPHFIDCNYGEPSFPETLHVPKLRELFNIVQFDFRGDLDIFKFCKADNGFEVVHLSPSNHKNIEVISLL
ncbi:hypothetical protein ACHWQZ_G016150 [Mnemiopsis leidyi]